MEQEIIYLKTGTYLPEEAKAGMEKWEDVKINVKSKEMEELALFAGEPNAYCYVDATSSEWCLYRGGFWSNGANAGVFNSYLNNPRSNSGAYLGGR